MNWILNIIKNRIKKHKIKMIMNNKIVKIDSKL